MFKIQIISDIRIDQLNPAEKVDMDIVADILIIAGGLGRTDKVNAKMYYKFLKMVSGLYETVILIDGVHDSHENSQYDKDMRILSNMLGNVRYLNDSYINLSGLIIYGTTLWFQCNNELINKLNDRHINNMTSFLDQNENNPNVLVVSYFKPCKNHQTNLERPIARESDLNQNTKIAPYLNSKYINTLVYGHSNYQEDYFTQGGTRVVCNQYMKKGYSRSKIIYVFTK